MNGFASSPLGVEDRAVAPQGALNRGRTLAARVTQVHDAATQLDDLPMLTGLLHHIDIFAAVSLVPFVPFDVPGPAVPLHAGTVLIEGESRDHAVDDVPVGGDGAEHFGGHVADPQTVRVVGEDGIRLSGRDPGVEGARAVPDSRRREPDDTRGLEAVEAIVHRVRRRRNDDLTPRGDALHHACQIRKRIPVRARRVRNHGCERDAVRRNNSSVSVYADDIRFVCQAEVR
jgi:hypothetical protein